MSATDLGRTDKISTMFLLVASPIGAAVTTWWAFTQEAPNEIFVLANESEVTTAYDLERTFGARDPRRAFPPLQVLLLEGQHNLLRSRWANLDVEILQLLCKLLDAVPRPEVTLFSVASEVRDPTLPRLAARTSVPRLTPDAISPCQDAALRRSALARHAWRAGC